MTKKILAIAPHPDDETLGCGGTLLRHISEGEEVHWLIMTTITEQFGYTKDILEARKLEINKVAKKYGFKSTFQANFESQKLTN